MIISPHLAKHRSSEKSSRLLKQQPASKIQMKHLAVLLPSPKQALLKASRLKTRENLNIKKNQLEIRHRSQQSTFGAKICQDNFSLYDILRRNDCPSISPVRELKSIRPKQIPSMSSLDRVHSEIERDKSKLAEEEKIDVVESNQRTKEMKMFSLKLEPVLARNKMSRKRYKDLSARELMYDEEEVPATLQESLQKALTKLLNRHRAATEGSSGR